MNRGEGSVAHRIFADISRDKLSKMSALADISHKCDKKSSRTFQRNFSEEKFLSEGPQSDCNRHEGPSLSVSRSDTEIHSPCVLRTRNVFRALPSARRGAARGAAPTPRKPSGRLDLSFVLGTDRIFCRHYGEHTRAFPLRGRGTASAVDEVRPCRRHGRMRKGKFF